MEKKISFGFSKVSKRTNIFVNKLIPKEDTNKIELIKYLEGKSIQLLEEKKEESPLIIPLKDNCKTSAALLSLKTRQAVLNGEQIPAEEATEKSSTEVNVELDKEGHGADDIEKRAARELLAEIGKGDTEDAIASTLVLPVKAEDLPLDGAKESTIDDYDSIPIKQFGLAMLRGMGWKDQPKKKGDLIDEGPMLRPKGMGLGADKALKPKALLVLPEANEILEIKKGACVRVLGGKHKDLYGQIEGLDEHAGRVIVKMTLGSTRESFNEFMVQPVSKKEYIQYSKCINSAKYDEYKKMEDENGKIIIKKEDKVKNENRDSYRAEGSHNSPPKNDDDDNKKVISSRRNSSESENYPRKIERRSRSYEKRSDEHPRSSTSHKKYSSKRTSRIRSKSDNSRSSVSSSYRSKHKKKSSKSKKSKKSKGKSREKRHSSQSSAEDDRRHKKKTKKSKRSRSRSRSKGRR